MKTLVAGLGKTGTTALFFKIKQVLPPAAYCLFEPHVYDPPAPGVETVLAKVLIGFKRPVKIEGFQSFDTKILLSRDPRDTLVSRVVYDIYNEPAIWSNDANVNALVTALRRKEADPRSVSLGEIIRLYDGMAAPAIWPRATGDPAFALEFQKANGDFIPYRYDDLIRGNYTAIEQSLGLRLHDGVIDVPEEFRRVSRTRSSGHWRHWLTPSDVDLFRPHVAPYLAYHGYGDDWTLAAVPQIDPAHGSHYVKQLVAERRRTG